jgi:hypothetical protein
MQRFNPEFPGEMSNTLPVDQKSPKKEQNAKTIPFLRVFERF